MSHKKRQQKRLPYPITQEEKDHALGTVFYEIQQFSRNSIRLLAPDLDPGMTNVHLEAMLIHVRALLDFFQEKERGMRKDGHEFDDVLSKDFEFPAERVDVPPETKHRLNTEVAHITYTRIKRVTPEQKKWPLSNFEPLVVRCTEFIRSRTEEEVRRCAEFRSRNGMPLISWSELKWELMQLQAALKRLERE